VPDWAGSPDAWREAINTDSSHYGGSNLGNGTGPLAVAPVPAHGRPRSIALDLPPLATLYLVPAR
jgi:1,4-alpha-glucan branching enzyme